MSSGPGLLALAIVLLLAMWGLADVVLGGARRASLRDRTAERVPEPASVRIARSLSESFNRTRLGRRLDVQLHAGAINLEPLTFVALALLAGIVGGLLVSLKFGTALSVLSALIVVRGVWFWLERKVEQRKDRFIAQLPELARVLSNAASAGLSIVGALEIAANELDEPASVELGIALEEVRIGQSFDRAFEHMAERMPSRELGVLVSTLVIQQRSGGDLVNALSDMAATLESRKDTLREVKTIMSGAVASAYIVAAMGVGIVFLTDAVSPGSIDRLTGSAIGILIVVVCAALYTVGLMAIRRITRVET
ncbi:MAG TPA: type II secretion system F family protein [Solirubrobacteraceae bacterium]|jgi:tight adherence protein B